VKKGAHWLGIGTENVVLVKTDCCGRMIPSHLTSCIQQTIMEGKKPFFVSATAGTTVLGAFDPLEELADVCHQYGLWLHVDVSPVNVSICFNQQHELKGRNKFHLSYY
jgi:glutamate/tyrosine decarboxylase-like PLP-dependent enzyme